MQTTPPPMHPDHDATQRVSGNHAHALTGEAYSYKASYLLLGTMVDWTAHVHAGSAAPARIGGSIRLSRGQTRGTVPKLVVLMVVQAIDAIQAAAAPM